VRQGGSGDELVEPRGCVVPLPSAGAFPHKYFEKLAYFPRAENTRPKHHVSPSNHHNLTSQIPHQNTQFLQNPLKNSRKTPKFSPHHSQDFFLQKTTGLGLQNGLEEQTDSHHP
jgi:hypothetical protein